MTKEQLEHIENLVVEGLNSQYESLSNMPSFVYDDEFGEFCAVIERVAREWAEECWQG